MKLIRGNARKARAEKLGVTTDEAYDEVTGEESRVRSEIEQLEGFIEEAPQIREQRDIETSTTLPPLDAELSFLQQIAQSGESCGDGEEEGDMQDRLSRRHLAAIRRERRKNFCVFLVSAAVVTAFLYWVSLVVQ